MFDPTSRSEAAGGAESPGIRQAADAAQRTRGRARLGVKADGAGGTGLQTFYQEGAAKIRLPREDGRAFEAVVINTAGGLTGGDVFAVEVDVAAGASASVAGQACEKIYKASSGTAVVTTDLAVGDGGRLDWLPQPTILFDRSALCRRTNVALSGSARLLAVESLVLGREAMGERLETARVLDSWRVRREGRLILADGFSIEGAAAEALSGPALLGPYRATATVMLAAPDAAAALKPVRDHLAGSSGPAGASLVGEVLVVRLAAPNGEALNGDLIGLLTLLRGRPLPRVWFC
ncbi:MAG: urease accessory protein UreD [Hyphomicrobiales bacterium]